MADGKTNDGARKWTDLVKTGSQAIRELLKRKAGNYGYNWDDGKGCGGREDIGVFGGENGGALIILESHGNLPPDISHNGPRTLDRYSYKTELTFNANHEITKIEEWRQDSLGEEERHSTIGDGTAPLSNMQTYTARSRLKNYYNALLIHEGHKTGWFR